MKTRFPLSVLLDYISMSSHKNTVMRKNKIIRESVKSIEKTEHMVDDVSPKKHQITQLRNRTPLTKVQWQVWLKDNLLEMKIASAQLKFTSRSNSSRANNGI